MTNKYLEKIAALYHVGGGIHYDDETNRYVVSEETADKYVKEHNFNHHMKALKVLPATFGALGVGMAATAAGKHWFTNPGNVLKKTGITGAVGAGVGLALAPFLAHGGNKQISRESKINGRVRYHLSKRDWK